jgi:hypothetical protein
MVTASKRALTAAARAMVTAVKMARARVARAMATATRVCRVRDSYGNKEGNGSSEEWRGQQRERWRQRLQLQQQLGW